MATTPPFGNGGRNEDRSTGDDEEGLEIRSESSGGKETGELGSEAGGGTGIETLRKESEVLGVEAGGGSVSVAEAAVVELPVSISQY